MKTVSLRPAVTDDLTSILKIEKRSYPEPWTQEHFIQEMQKPFARVQVLTDDETDSIVIGYIVYWVQAEGASLLNVAVDPDWRHFGFAKKLMHSMVNEVVRDEIPRISLEVRASNDGAIALYRAIGFTQIHERKAFYQNGETALVMELKTSDLNGMIQ